MKTVTAVILATMICAGCVPKVRLTVETRDPQGGLIVRGDVTNTDSSGRDFQVNANGTVLLTAAADYTDGLEEISINGGFSCTKIVGGIGVTQQGTTYAADPALPGQHPASSSFQLPFAVQCSGGSYVGTFRACATAAKSSSGGSSCTKDATLK
jgi:hypothetical protein